MLKKRKTLEIYRDAPSAVGQKQLPAKVESSAKTVSVSARDRSTFKTETDLLQAPKHPTKPTLGKESQKKNKKLAEGGEVSFIDTKSPKKVLKKIEPEVDKAFTKDSLDEEAHRKSCQKEISSETKLEVGQIRSESPTLKASTLTPSQKISGDSQGNNGAARDENDAVGGTTVKHIDEPLTKAICPTARQVSFCKEDPIIARIGYPGLINDKNSCYQNTAFQILANIKPFADRIKRTRWASYESPVVATAVANLNIVFKRGTAPLTKYDRFRARKAVCETQYANRAPHKFKLTNDK